MINHIWLLTILGDTCSFIEFHSLKITNIIASLGGRLTLCCLFALVHTMSISLDHPTNMCGVGLRASSSQRRQKNADEKKGKGVVLETHLDFTQRMKTQYQAVDDPVLISIRKYIMKRAIKERGNHACLIWRSMFYFGHRIAILSTNNPIIKKTDASPRFVKRRGNLSILQHYLQNHLHCSQLLNMINFTDVMASAFNTFNFTVRNDVLLSDSKLLFRN